MRDIIFLVGPTAVGKTEISIHLAKLINAEIVSCDSMQVYRHMDIGTEKPLLSQRRQVPHHMIDIISPARSFSVSDFRKKALKHIRDIHSRGRIPLFVGGTALYMKALTDGLFPGPSADRRLRRQLQDQEHRRGRGSLHAELTEVDPQTAGSLHPNDTRRIIRALEVYIKTGAPISKLKKETAPLSEAYNVKIIWLDRNRQELYERINRRVDKMFRRGLLAECKRLRRRKLSMTASQALGYREAFAHLDSSISMKETRELIKKNTRNMAKRQLCWFRNYKDAIRVDIGAKSAKDMAKDISRICMK